MIERVVQWARKYRILYRLPDGSACYESKGPDHSELLIVHPDGSRSSEEIAMCGFCLDRGGRCEYHPDGPVRDVFGPVYGSDLLAERQAVSPVREPVGAAEPEPVPVPESAPVLVVESPPEAAPEVVQAAKTLAFQVRSRGVMHRSRFSHSPEGLDYAVAMDWVVVVDDEVRPGAVNSEPMTALPDERSSRGWTSRVFSR